MDYIYVIQKGYVNDSRISYERNPIAASDDYETVVPPIDISGNTIEVNQDESLYS